MNNYLKNRLRHIYIKATIKQLPSWQMPSEQYQCFLSNPLFSKKSLVLESDNILD